jgi:hypothetical protein
MARKCLTAWLSIILLGGSLAAGCKLGDITVRVTPDGAGRITLQGILEACLILIENPFTESEICSAVFQNQHFQLAAKTIHEPGVPIALTFSDPVIVQFPATVTNFTGTFDDGLGTAGNLVIQSNLASLPVDASTTLISEPGNQLVIISLPSPSPVTTSK